MKMLVQQWMDGWMDGWMDDRQMDQQIEFVWLDMSVCYEANILWLMVCVATRHTNLKGLDFHTEGAFP